MGWKRIGGHDYWYQSERRDGRVVTTYIGGGDCGQLMAILQWERRLEREDERERRRAEREAFQAEGRAFSEWFDQVQALADAAIASAGFHKRKGQWRRKTMSEKFRIVATSIPAEDGLPALDGDPPGDLAGQVSQSEVDGFGSSSEWLRLELMETSWPREPFARDMVGLKLDQVKAELEGPNPTPIERLLAERASLCWFIVNRCERDFELLKGVTIKQAEHQQRKIDRAHARFLSAVRTLAQVRKLALPALQVNIGRNQVNVQR